MIRIEGVHVVALAAVLLLTPTAQAKQRTIYDAQGRVQSRTHTGSDGTVTVYADGKVQGRTSTDSSDTVTIYFADGRETGSVKITPKPQSKGK